MTDKNKDPHFKRLLGLLRMVVDSHAAERTNAAKKFARSWTKAETEAEISVAAMIAWTSKDPSFVNNLGKTDNAAIKDLFVTGAHEGFTLTQDPFFEKMLEKVHDHYEQQSAEEEKEKRHLVLLSIVAFEKQARKQEKQNHRASAENYRNNARTLIEKYGFSQKEIDTYDLLREKNILWLYQTLDRLSLLKEPSEKAELQIKFNNVARKFGLLKESGGTISYTDELSNGYTDDYLSNPEHYIRELNMRIARTDPNLSGAYGTSAPYDTAIEPTHVSVYPVRDYLGHVFGYIGATSFLGALEKFTLNKPDVSFTQDFPINGLTLDAKDSILIQQLGAVENATLEAKKICWETPASIEAAPVANSTFTAETATITLGSSTNVAIVAIEDATIKLTEHTTGATLDIRKTGYIKIADLFEQSTIMSNPTTCSIDFTTAKARALNSKFLGCLPIVHHVSGTTISDVHEMAVQTLLSIEEAFVSSFKLGVCGYHFALKKWSPAFANPHYLELSENEEVVIDTLMQAQEEGYESRMFQSTTRFQPPGLLDHAEDKNTWKTFYKKVSELDDPTLHLVVHPMLTTKDCFLEKDRIPSDTTFCYRLMFIGGNVDHEELAEKLNVPLTSKSPHGYPPKFFYTLQTHYTQKGCPVFYHDIAINPTSPLPTAPTAFSNALEKWTLDRAEKIQALDKVDELFEQTRFFFYGNQTDDQTITRLDVRGTAFLGQVDDENGWNPEREGKMRQRALHFLGTHECLDLDKNDEEKDTRIVVNGSIFEGCTFSGTFENVELNELSDSHFEDFTGSEFIVSGNWSRADFSNSEIKGTLIGDVVFDDVVVKSSTFSFNTGLGDSFHASKLSIDEGKIVFDGVKNVVLPSGNFLTAHIVVKNADKVDLRNCFFYGATITLVNVKELVASSSTLFETTLTFEGADEINMDMANTTFANTTLKGKGQSLHLNGSSILGTSHLEGRFSLIEAHGAVLGPEISSPEKATWKLRPKTMKAKDIILRNVELGTEAFGQFDDDVWQNASVLGCLYLDKNEEAFFDNLSKVRNYMGEHAPLQPKRKKSFGR